MAQISENDENLTRANNLNKLRKVNLKTKNEVFFIV